MNKSETIDNISRSADMTKADAKRVVDALEQSIKAHADAGERVMLRGLVSRITLMAPPKIGIMAPPEMP